MRRLIPLIGSASLILVVILLIQAVTDGKGQAIAIYAGWIGVCSITGAALGWLGRRFSSGMVRLVLLILGGAALYFLLRFFGKQESLEAWKHLSYYLFVFVIFSPFIKSSEVPNTPEAQARMVTFQAGVDGAIVFGGAGAMVLILLQALHLPRNYILPVFVLVLVLTAVGAGVGVILHKQKVARRQRLVEQNPELVKLYYQLGDGVKYDSVAGVAVFRSPESRKSFQASAPGWKVKDLGQAK